MRVGLYVGTGAAILGIGWLIVRGLKHPPGDGGPAPKAPAPSSGRGQLTGSGPLTVFPGRTYFATLETNGSVSAAANVDRIKARAEAEGFRDVVVSRARIPNWPGTIGGDYFVRGTFTGAAPKNFARHVDVFLGSLNVLDAWEA